MYISPKMGKYAKYNKNYNPAWENEPLFKGWLQESNQKAGAYCKICKSELRAHKTDLKLHAGRQIHQNNLKKYGFKNLQAQSTLTNLGISSTKTVSETTKQLELKLAAYVAFHSSIRGVDHLTDIINEHTDKNLKMHRTKCAALLKNVISPSLLQEILEDLGNSSFSIIVDESTDISTVKYMAVCIRYFSIKHSIMRTEYLGMYEVVRATSEALYDSLKEFLTTNYIDITKMIGIGTDGASNMTGKHNSLFALLKKDLPELQLVRCVCHSIHLCSAKAVEELPSNLDFITRETYNWFSHSSLRKAKYLSVYSLINDGEKPLKMTSPAPTRWLSHYECIEKILGQWLELQTHFNICKDQEKCYVARMLAEMYKDQRNYLYFVFLKPILKELNETNILFQSDNVDAEKIHDNLKSLIISVCSRILSKNFKDFLFEQKWKLETLEATLNNNLSFCQVNDVDYGYIFEIKVQESGLNHTDILNIKTRCYNFLKRLAHELTQRLPSNVKSLETLKYFSPNLCLSQTRPKFSDLINSNLVDFSDLESQWRNLLTVDWRAISPDGEIPQDSVQFWSLILNYKNAIREECFAKLAKYVLNKLSLPISNAVVERVFSVLNAIKTKPRNRLNLPMLDALMRLRLYCYARKLCCKNFVISADMTKRFTSKMYIDLSSNETEVEQYVEAVNTVNNYF